MKKELAAWYLRVECGASIFFSAMVQVYTAQDILQRDDFAVFLQTREAEDLLKHIEQAQGDALRCTRTHPFVQRLLQLWHVRKKHAHRFENAGKMLFTSVGAEQATGDAIAQYKATWCSGRVLVACSGIGGELRALAPVSTEIIAVDSSWETLVCAAWNTREHSHIRFIHAPLEEVVSELGTFDHCFFDPDRRPGGQRRVQLEDYVPNPVQIREQVNARAFHMKVSPLLRDPSAESITWIAEDHALKECVLHWGGSYPPVVQIVKGQPYVLPDVTHTEAAEDALVALSPALLRAGLVAEVAAALQAEQLHPSSSLLRTTYRSPELAPFVTRYAILEELPYAPKVLRKKFRGTSLVIKKRFFPLEPAEIRKQLSVQEGGDLILFCTTKAPHERVAYLCRRLHDA